MKVRICFGASLGELAWRELLTTEEVKQRFCDDFAQYCDGRRVTNAQYELTGDTVLAINFDHVVVVQIDKSQGDVA